MSQPCLKNTYMHCKENACSTQVKLIFMCEYKNNKLSRRCKVTLGTKMMVLNVLTVMDTPQLGHRLLNSVTVTVMTTKKALEWNFPMIFVINQKHYYLIRKWITTIIIDAFLKSPPTNFSKTGGWSVERG